MILSEQQRMIRDMARDFAQSELSPNAAEWDRTATFPEAAIARMGELGLMGMIVPEEWGGAGAGYLCLALALEEIAAGDGACATVMSLNNSPCCAALLKQGSEAQKERFLRPLAKGEMLAAFGLTDPQAGSDAANLHTRARLEGNKYVLSGTKQFITSGSTADIALTFALTDEQAGKRGISCFIVPTDTPGYSVGAIEKKLGQRASDTCQIILDNVEVVPELMLGQPGQGYAVALASLEGGRIAVAAQAVGIARAAFEAALGYAKERRTFGKAIIEHQAVAFRLADMATRIETARQMAHHAARLKDAGQPCVKEASMAKLFASEMAERVCSDAIQIHGGYGYVGGFPVERYWRDVRACQIYEGTSDVQRLVISRALAAD